MERHNEDPRSGEIEKPRMQEPQEEFISDEAVPSHPTAPPPDRKEGDETEQKDK